MNVLIVIAHPDRNSLNSALANVIATSFLNQGHQVKFSNLYDMNWKSEITHEDFPKISKKERLHVAVTSQKAFQAQDLTKDVLLEQEKLRWADGVVFQFPLWWFSMPAILKGWFERVYSYGFAYGVGEHNDKHWGDRYGEGVMKGKRAMLSVTCGGWESHYSNRGINGPINDLLFPINHGILYYPGFDVLPSFVQYKVDHFNEDDFKQTSDQLKNIVDNFWTEKPIKYRQQNNGEYTIPDMRLKSGIEKMGSTGFAIHES